MSEGGDAAPTGGFAPSYSWIGAPTQFNGTNALTGGDSCQFHSLPWEIVGRDLIQCVNSHASHGKFESMVYLRRPSLHHHGLGHGRHHGTRSRIFILWTCTKKIRSQHDLRLHGLVRYYHVSMVLLGLLFGLFSPR